MSEPETKKPAAAKAPIAPDKTPAPIPGISGPTMVVTRASENMIREGHDDLAASFAQAVGAPCFAVLSEKCPLDSVAFGKITFHKRTFKRGEGGDMLFQRGQAVTITPEEQKWLEKDLRTRVLRITYAYDQKEKSFFRMGQQDIARAHWVRAGLEPAGEVKPGDQVLVADEGGQALVKNSDYALHQAPKGAPADGTDHTFHRYVSLVKVMREHVPTMNMLGIDFEGLAGEPDRVNPLEEARALNEAEDQEPQTPQSAAERARQNSLKAARMAGAAGRE